MTGDRVSRGPPADPSGPYLSHPIFASFFWFGLPFLPHAPRLPTRTGVADLTITLVKLRTWTAILSGLLATLGGGRECSQIRMPRTPTSRTVTLLITRDALNDT